jgi:hypothetical protein
MKAWYCEMRRHFGPCRRAWTSPRKRGANPLSPSGKQRCPENLSFWDTSVPKTPEFLGQKGVRVSSSAGPPRNYKNTPPAAPVARRVALQRQFYLVPVDLVPVDPCRAQ